MAFLAADRGQSIQIGAVLLFGALVVLFAVYQAFIVPNQNRAVEFNHNQRVEGDMVEVRNEILESYTSGEDGYATVELGTSFPARLIGINPAPPSGSLYNTEPRPVVVSEGGTAVTDAVCPPGANHTRFLEYDPSYSLYGEAGTLRYETSVVYHDFGSGNVPLSGQRLVTNDTVRLVALQTSMNVGGSRTVPVEPIAGQLNTTEVSDPTITVPTQLSNETWVDLLEGEVDPGNVSVSDAGSWRNLTLSLSGTVTVECGPVGVGQAPPGGPRDDEDGGADEINPAAPGEIRLVDESASGRTVELRFNNTGSRTNFTEARINFFQSSGGGGGNQPTEAQVFANGQLRTTLQVRGDYQPFTPPIDLPANTERDVTLEFDASGGGQSWFVITFILESGQRAQYFVPAG